VLRATDDAAATRREAEAHAAAPKRPQYARWLVAVPTLAPERRSVLFEVVTRVIFHAMVVFALFLLFSGHNAPGGGFAAGLVVGIALTVRYLAGGRYELGEAAPVHPGLLLGTGLFLSAGVGLAALLSGNAAVQSFAPHISLPVLGEVHLVTSLFFDIGVFLVVVGLVLDILRTLGAEIDRQGDADSAGETALVAHAREEEHA
jgi:multicomponent Na+:H+ antiporter subunit A